MLTGKQRSYLKGLAHNLKSMTQLGKEGMSDAFLDQLSHLLDQHELIKINVLDNSMESAQHAALEICTALNAEFVQAIGNKFVIYRQSRIDPMIEIPGGDNSRVKMNLQRKAAQGKKEERITKKGGKVSRPLQGTRSAAKAKKAEEEAAEKAKAFTYKPSFKRSKIEKTGKRGQ